MISLTEKEVSTAIENLSKTNAKGETSVARYMTIQGLLRHDNVRKSDEFQRRFNAFYRVRRDDKWRQSFFSTFQKSLDGEGATFLGVIAELRKKTGRVEASFASKLIASINPHKPVIDSVVLKNLGLKLPARNDQNRAASVAAVYERLEKALNEFLCSSSWPRYEKMFDQRFPEAAKIAPLKKLDLILWQQREK